MLIQRAITTVFAAMAFASCGEAATMSVVDLTTRGITERFEYVRPDTPIANVVVLPAGDGVLQIQADGAMTARNAKCDPIIRNQAAFTRRGYALSFVDAPSDERAGLSNAFVTSPEHIGDVLEIIAFMRKRSDVPTWVIGGGPATQSALAIAIGYPTTTPLGTVVLSNDDNAQYNAEAEVGLVRGPTLVVNHAKGKPAQGELLYSRLLSAQPRQYVMLSGGGNEDCGFALFEGIDADIVGVVGGFIDRNNVALGGPQPLVKVAVEYYNEDLDHYFITHVASEIAILDKADAAGGGWARTGGAFNVLSMRQDGLSPVCRFYLPPASGDSHFYGRGESECAATARQNPTFVLEDAQFFYAMLPDGGTCPAGTRSVYRTFDNRGDANHRYTVEQSIREQMVAKGWLAEGDGPDLVAMCAPM